MPEDIGRDLLWTLRDDLRISIGKISDLDAQRDDIMISFLPGDLLSDGLSVHLLALIVGLDCPSYGGRVCAVICGVLDRFCAQHMKGRRIVVQVVQLTHDAQVARKLNPKAAT